MITLQPIDKDNWTQSIRLKAKTEQQSFIAPNLYSIAQVQFLDNFEAMAIYDDTTMVGFTMYGKDSDDGHYWMYRFMIDADYQGKGYGKQALQLVMEAIRNKPDRTDMMMLSYEPGNELGRQIYAKAGFEEIGITSWSEGEVVAQYRIQ
ncbi:GNAT family N-acetyltransferase [Paenibacillus sp. JCM 10914]|uniref:GNAT family N-acetyltransferase n=1 Tax=Paenibacillus sp. JCM 10914 TaxID=1236974 RepID=UPI0003CC4BB5|nr:GNAT family N-acetyltransferase [Paenibacillus sp. JCM 10914]GAE06860.1 spermine/spermidine acetyltransferase [Paenibacillus sp. JCM 10914]